MTLGEPLDDGAIQRRLVGGAAMREAAPSGPIAEKGEEGKTVPLRGEISSTVVRNVELPSPDNIPESEGHQGLHATIVFPGT